MTISSFTGKPLYLFAYEKKDLKKHLLNTYSELLQDRIEKQIMPSKIRIHWLFNDI